VGEAELPPLPRAGHAPLLLPQRRRDVVGVLLRGQSDGTGWEHSPCPSSEGVIEQWLPSLLTRSINDCNL
jgi:hypothetical protein